MADLTAVDFGLLGILLLLGLVLGWIVRGNRCAKEKIAVNAGWRDQIAAQKSEHGRLAQQNKSLMEQISENQASHKDSKMRAQELSDSLKETFERRDELQRQVKEIRGNLDLALAQRNKLQTDVEVGATTAATVTNSIKEKDDMIFYLSRELQSWQDRVPPLVERFRIRDLEAQQMEADLKEARVRIDALQVMTDPTQTHIESVGSNTIADGLSASNCRVVYGSGVAASFVRSVPKSFCRLERAHRSDCFAFGRNTQRHRNGCQEWERDWAGTEAASGKQTV